MTKQTVITLTDDEKKTMLEMKTSVNGRMVFFNSKEIPALIQWDILEEPLKKKSVKEKHVEQIKANL
jgi:hypothetical protein